MSFAPPFPASSLAPSAADGRLGSSDFGRLLRRRDRLACEILIRSVRPDLLRRAARHCDGRLQAKFDCEDVVQEACADLHAGLPTFHSETKGQFLSYAFTVLNHQLINFRRRFCLAQSRSVERERRLEAIDGGDQPAFFASGLEPVDDLVDNERLERLRGALDRLPSELTKLLELRYVEGRSWIELEQHLGRDRDALRALVKRCVNRLRREIAIDSSGA